MSCEPSQPSLYAIVVGIFSLVLIFIIISVMRLVYNYFTSTVKPEKTLFLIGLTFHLVSCTSLTCFVAWLLINLLQCVQIRTKIGPFSRVIIFNTFAASSVLQIHLLHLLWLKRLRYVFKGTTWQIRGSVYHPYMVVLLCSFALIASWAALSTQPKPSGPEWLIYAALYALSSTLLCLLLRAFVSKLNALYVTSHNPLVDNSDLEHIVVKSLVLGASSLFCSFIMTPILCVGFVAQAMPIEVLLVFYALDILTNLECVVLSYSYNEGLYYTVLGCVHSRVHAYYARYMAKQVQLEVQRQRRQEEERKKQKEEEEEAVVATRSARLTNTETPDTNATAGTLDTNTTSDTSPDDVSPDATPDIDDDASPSNDSHLKMQKSHDTHVQHQTLTTATASMPHLDRPMSKMKSFSIVDAMEVEESRSGVADSCMDPRALVLRQLSVASIMKSPHANEQAGEMRSGRAATCGTRLQANFSLSRDDEVLERERTTETSISAFKQPSFSVFKQKSISMSLRANALRKKKTMSDPTTSLKSITHSTTRVDLQTAPLNELNENDREEWDLAIVEVEETDDAEPNIDDDDDDNQQIQKQNSTFL